MNVWVTVMTCILISSASIGASYYVYVLYYKKKEETERPNDMAEEMVSRMESPVIIPIKPETNIKLLSNNISKICKRGVINHNSSKLIKGYHWYNYPLVNDNFMFKLSLSVGLKEKKPVSVKIDDDYNITIIHQFCEVGTKINLYLSGAYFSEYLDDFIFIDDISKYDKKSGIYTFDKKPLLMTDGLDDILCKFDNRSIKLQII